MISRAVLVVLMRVELVILLVSLVLFFTHGLWLFLYERRRARVVGDARLRLARAINSPKFSTDDVRGLARVPDEAKSTVFLELARNLSGERKDHLRAVARASGLVDYARGLTRSWLWTRRLRGARILAQLDQADPVIRDLLRDSSAAVRVQAAEWAASQPTPLIVTALLELLADPTTQARFAVEDALLQLGTSIVPQLQEFLERKQGEAVTAGLMVATAIGDTRFLPIALRHSGSPDTRIKGAAMRLLGVLGGNDAASRLGTLLEDPDPGIRGSAAAGIGKLRGWEWAPRLEGLLSDPEWRVRREAAFGLREIGGPGILLLRRAASSANRLTAEIAQLALDVPAGAR